LLEAEYGITLDLVHNGRALEWNSAYSLWLAREYFGRGVLLVNGDTVHPVSVAKTLLAAKGSGAAAGARVIIAVDNVKPVAGAGMKVALDARGLLTRISGHIDPARAYGEYVGATLIGPSAAVPLADALETTWRRDPGLRYEDGYQELADRGGDIAAVPIGDVDWVEVNDHGDLRRAREIAARC
jgi:choline kinase